jgi:predicted phosphoadenosine phosphosulfate sulfurtransferase
VNVFEAAKERISTVFSEFDNVYVSFSGGKDSGVLLNLAVDHARAIGRRISVFHIDYEAQYQMTTDYVDATLASIADIADIYRICLPIAAQCATSMHDSYWIPWDQEKRDLWVRQLPGHCVNEQNHGFDWFVKGMWDYELQEQFASWIHERNNAKRTCCLVGIRTQESLNRWRAIHSDNNQNKFNGLNWTLEMSPNVVNAYPIFDWKADDVWTANAKMEWDYNKLYDLFWKAGLSVDMMRVASPFNDCAIESLKLYKVIDPDNWGKMVGRVNGVNFAGLYGGTTAMGWKSIKLPPGHTWKSYMEFLLTTLPKETAENYKKKLSKSQEFWKEKGGCLSESLIAELREEGVAVDCSGSTNYATDKIPARMDYLDDTDASDFKAVPTYKRMCVCIMKNDHLCKYMGFSLTKTETQMRAEASKKYRSITQ